MRLPLLALLGSVLAVLPVTPALASSGGVAGDGCGCHGSGEVGIDVSASAMMISPGDTVTMTVTLSSPTAAEAGLFLEANAGQLSTLAGQGLAEVMAGLTHSQPRAMSGGQAQLAFEWTAPASPGAVRFEVWAVAANGNNNSSGDVSDDAAFDFVFGCAPQTYYRDFDGDGYGRTLQPLTHCAGTAPAGYAPLPDDCDDNRAQTYPGATEFCNQIDDDCDGETDEEALPVDLYPDADGDGYYGLDEFSGGVAMMGCVPTEGFAAEPGDCRPEDPLINPGAEEVCNGFDDDCDSDVDERVRPLCGEGWCRRESVNCDPANCTPGEPREEECNFFDDDCDGAIDEDAPCPEGNRCQAGECRPAEPGPEGLDDSGGSELEPTVGDDSGTSDGAGQDSEAAGGCSCRSSRDDGPGSLAVLTMIMLMPTRRRGRR